MVSGNGIAEGPDGGMDATATLRATEATITMRRAAELEEMRLAAHWAALHSTDPAEEPGEQRGRGGRDRLVRLGGQGTPGVRELCLAELGIARQVATGSARAHLACVLDLQHRLPRLWSVTETLAVEGWLARRIATLTRHLTPDQAAGIDTAIAPVAATLAPSRLLALVEALVVEADPAAEQARREQARTGRFVRLGRVDDQGLRMVVPTSKPAKPPTSTPSSTGSPTSSRPTPTYNPAAPPPAPSKTPPATSSAPWPWAG